MKSLRAASAFTTQLTTKPLRPLTATFTQQQQQRSFLPNLFAPTTQSLKASRILPYSPDVLYSIISDVNSYHSFLPFCRSSTITSYSNPDANGQKHPETGTLIVGFNDDVSETFHSRIYCVPGSIVEAVSGKTDTELPAKDIAHHSARPKNHNEDPTRNANVLTHLLTRWTLKPFHYKPGPMGAGANPPEATAPLPPREQTQVSLNIEYAFANPLYAALSAAAAPKVADKMIAAFEERVRKTMDRPSH